METLNTLIREIIAEGAKEVGPCYNPRCASAKGILENKGLLRTHFTWITFLENPTPVKFVRNNVTGRPASTKVGNFFNKR